MPTKVEPTRERAQAPARHARTAHPGNVPIPMAARVGLSILLICAVAGAWVGARAWMAKGELEEAQRLVGELQSEVAAGDYAAVSESFDEIRGHAARAREMTADPVWRASERVPLLGRNLTAMRGLASVVDGALTAGEPLVAVATQLSPESLAPRDGVIPLEPIVQVGDRLPQLAADLTRLRSELEVVPVNGTLPQLAQAKATLTAVMDRGAAALDVALPIAEALPAILGAEGPRTYVVMFLNNSEPRSLGGTALSFAEISVDGGAIELVRVLPAGRGNFPRHIDPPVIPRLEQFEEVYPGALGTFIPNATLRPSAVTAAEIVQAEWRVTFGMEIDAVISMDGGALSLLLEALGPVTLDSGEVVTSTNVLDLLFNQVYSRFNSGDVVADDIAQNAVYSQTISGTFSKLTSGQFSPTSLVDRMTVAAEEGRMSVWFADPSEREAFAPTPFAAEGLPQSPPGTDVVGVYLNDQVGSKLGYYLASTVTTASAVCTDDGRPIHRITLTLTNVLSPDEAPGLSESITGSAFARLGLEKGHQRYILFFYLPQGATLLSASVDSSPVEATGQVDAGHPVQVMWVDSLAPGATTELRVDVLGTPGADSVVAEVTPTVKGTEVVGAELECADVAIS